MTLQQPLLCILVTGSVVTHTCWGHGIWQETLTVCCCLDRHEEAAAPTAGVTYPTGSVGMSRPGWLLRSATPNPERLLASKMGLWPDPTPRSLDQLCKRKKSG